MEFLQELFMLLGRILISGMFLWGAYDRIKNWHSSVSYMKAKNVPQVSIVLPVGIALKIVGALLVLFGWHAHIGALLLLIVAIPFTYWAHPFWKAPANEKMLEKALFVKEMGIIGGLLLLLALGAGHIAIGG
jgi:putative oxidoreductase